MPNRLVNSSFYLDTKVYNISKLSNIIESLFCLISYYVYKCAGIVLVYYFPKLTGQRKTFDY